MRIQGKDCTLTVARDGEFIPIPYSEQVVRLTSNALCLGEKRLETFVVHKKDSEKEKIIICRKCKKRNSCKRINSSLKN